MTPTLPYREISPWVDPPADLQPAVAGDLRVDTVVIDGRTDSTAYDSTDPTQGPTHAAGSRPPRLFTRRAS